MKGFLCDDEKTHKIGSQTILQTETHISIQSFAHNQTLKGTLVNWGLPHPLCLNTLNTTYTKYDPKICIFFPHQWRSKGQERIKEADFPSIVLINTETHIRYIRIRDVVLSHWFLLISKTIDKHRH